MPIKFKQCLLHNYNTSLGGMWVANKFHACFGGRVSIIKKWTQKCVIYTKTNILTHNINGKTLFYITYFFKQNCPVTSLVPNCPQNYFSFQPNYQIYHIKTQTLTINQFTKIVKLHKKGSPPSACAAGLFSETSFGNIGKFIQDCFVHHY